MPENPSWLSLLIPYVVVLAVFYFILILPQKRKDKQRREMLSALKVGDEVLTVGGIYGKVINIKDDIFTIEAGADKTKLKIARWAIQNVESAQG